jgi:hypothetical protein
MRPFMTVNPSVRCLLKAILSASSRTEAGSAPKAKGAVGPDCNGSRRQDVGQRT